MIVSQLKIRVGKERADMLRDSVVSFSLKRQGQNPSGCHGTAESPGIAAKRDQACLILHDSPKVELPGARQRTHVRELGSQATSSRFANTMPQHGVSHHSRHCSRNR